MAYTPTLIVAASNLTSNVGLAPNTSMIAMGNTIKSNSLIAAYDSVKPGTANGTILQTAGYSVATLGLPSFITNVSSTITSVTSQANKILPNVSTFATLVTIAGSFTSISYRTSSALEEFKSISFDNLGIDVSNHQTSVTNGIANMLDGDNSTPEKIKQNLTTFANAIKNFGTCYDASNLSKLGNPAAFATHLINNGYDLSLPGDWETITTAEQKAYLDQIIGPVFTRVITLSGIVIPKGHVVLSLGDLLNLELVFPEDALNLIPGKDFSGLANIFVNLGGKFKSFDDVANLFSNIEVPNLTYLNTYTAPVSNFDYSTLSQKLGSGSGPYNNNPTITDLVGTAAGVPHLSKLTTINGYLTSIASWPSTVTLVTQLQQLALACSGGDIPTAFTAVQSAATAFNSNVSSIVSVDTTIPDMLAHLQLEVDNLAIVGVNLNSIDNGGTPSVLGLVNNLHDYGVDKEQLNYNQLFAGVAQANAGGDAVLASLAEGKNVSIQAQYSVPIGTKSSTS